MQRSLDASKFIVVEGELVANRMAATWPRSAILTTLIANFYATAIPRYVSGSVLDAGCGTAPLLPYYGRYTDHSVRLDWPASPHESRNLSVIGDLNFGLPFADNSFQCVLLSDVLEHLRAPALVLSEVSRVLAPGGYLVGNVPFAYPLHETPHDYYRFTSFGLELLFETADLHVVQILALGGAADTVADLATKALARVPVVKQVSGNLGWAWTRLPERLHRVGTSRLPLAYGFVCQSV